VYKPLLATGCGGNHSWLSCGNSTTKRPDHAMAHTRGRWKQLYKIQLLNHKIQNMKTVRLFAGLFLILNGILHIIEYLNISSNPGSIGILAFGLIYIIVGVLLFNKKLYPVYLGLIIPIIGMTLSIIKFGIPELISLSALFKLIGLIVVICCAYILINRKRLNTSTT
jgi:uncharacterized membrane protein HdeD (DUF308 family)